MTIYLVTSSERVIFQEYIEAEDEDLARIDAMKRQRSVPLVGHQGYGVDSVEEWEGDLPPNAFVNREKQADASKVARDLAWELIKGLGN